MSAAEEVLMSPYFFLPDRQKLKVQDNTYDNTSHYGKTPAQVVL